MIDPFEVRVRFSGQLQHLNASVTSAQKAAQFALKHRDMHEDLHSCIIEQLEQNDNLNIRANIMYFIEHFLDAARRDCQEAYIRMMQRDIIRVVDSVAPDDRSGATNVSVVRKVLRSLQAKGFLTTQIVAEIEEGLKDRESAEEDVNIVSHIDGELDLSNNPPSQTIPRPGQRGAMPRLDKRQVEQRIEEDRERHKRLRENIWAVTEDEEISKLWEEISDFGDDDLCMMSEESEERQKCIRPCEVHTQVRVLGFNGKSAQA